MADCGGGAESRPAGPMEALGAGLPDGDGGDLSPLWRLEVLFGDLKSLSGKERRSYRFQIICGDGKICGDSWRFGSTSWLFRDFVAHAGDSSLRLRGRGAISGNSNFWRATFGDLRAGRRVAT